MIYKLVSTNLLSPIFSLQNYNPCPSTCSIFFFFLGAYLLTYLCFLFFICLSTSSLSPCIPNQFTLTNSVYPVLVVIAYYLAPLPQSVYFIGKLSFMPNLFSPPPQRQGFLSCCSLWVPKAVLIDCTRL